MIGKMDFEPARKRSPIEQGINKQVLLARFEAAFSAITEDIAEDPPTGAESLELEIKLGFKESRHKAVEVKLSLDVATPNIPQSITKEIENAMANETQYSNEPGEVYNAAFIDLTHGWNVNGKYQHVGYRGDRFE